MEVKNLDFFYGKDKILNNISLKIKRGKITTVIGANGSGKSTLFNIMTKNLKPQMGTVFLDGEDINKISLKSFARRVAIVHQYNTAPYDTTVETLVGYGRLPYSQYGICDREEDEKCILNALEATELTYIRKCKIADLSGGQQQRVWIAMALAQNTDILFLDEPTTYLDVKYQIEILRLIKRLNEKHNMTVVMVLHDINQAAFYSHEMIALKKGEIIASDFPENILNKSTIYNTFDIDLKIEKIENKKIILAV